MEKLYYHAFRKPKTLKNGKKVYRWYYYWLDNTGKQIQKSCGTKIKKREDAETYIRTLPPPETASAAIVPTAGGILAKPIRAINKKDLLVRQITESMYIPESLHVKRRKQLKKSTSMETLVSGRRFIGFINKVWGDRMLRSLELDEVMNYIFSLDRSGSWKNSYITVLNEIYQEAQFLGCKIYKPDFPSIGRESNKADMMDEAELEAFFRPQNFAHDFFLFFLCSLSGGLRLGEIRGLRVKQIIFDKSAVIIDGFMKDDNKTRTSYNKRGSPEHPKLRVVLYPDFTLTLLKRHIERTAVSGDDFVFQYEGKPISKSLAETCFIKALMNAGLTWDKETLVKKGYWQKGHITIKRDLTPTGKRLVPHSMRFTYITRMSLYVDAHDLYKMTGHDSREMIDYYNRKNLEMALTRIPKADDGTRALLPAKISNV